MKRLLLVDDEPLILRALTRMLHDLRKEWDIQNAGGGQQALDLMAKSPFDVVISDMRMPNMNGAQLLAEIMNRHPQTVRIILSGFADSEMTMKCVGVAHQFMSKPCDSEALRATLHQVSLRDHRLNNEAMRTLVSRMVTVPSLPSLYLDILKELRSADAGLANVGAKIAEDPGMTLKILQLVNSAFFGLSRRLESPTEAVMQLGMETVKSLVLMVHIFTEFNSSESARLQVEKLFHHSLGTANLAKRIAKLEKLENAVVDECFSAGLLHDVGRLALIANLPDQYALAVSRSQAEGISLSDAEQAVFGANHSEVGGYLLSLWGLPAGLVEAAHFHHLPSLSSSTRFTALTAVHVANELQKIPPPATFDELASKLDRDYLTKTNVWEQIPAWQESLRETEPARN